MLKSLELANHFSMQVINGDLSALSRPVLVAELDRPGLELMGLFQFHQKDRIILLGNKEIALISDSDPDFIYANCVKMFSPECPAVIITQNNACPEPVLKAARECNVPLFSCGKDTSELSSSMYIFLSEALAPRTALHACLLEIFGIGVLIMGHSGIGKSEISLELIHKGHRLVADDRVDVAAVRGSLIGTCPDSIYGMLEVRGIGIVNIEKLYGINSLTKKTIIKLALSLDDFKSTEPIERIGMKTEHTEILGESLPIIKLPVSAARSMAEIVEVAVTNYKLKDEGYDTGYEFQRRLEEIRERKRNDKNNLSAIDNLRKNSND